MRRGRWRGGKVGAGAACDVEDFLAIYGEVVAEDAPAEAEHGDVDGEEPGSGEEEAVEG